MGSYYQATSGQTSEAFSSTSAVSACIANRGQTCERVSVGRQSLACNVLWLTDDSTCTCVPGGERHTEKKAS